MAATTALVAASVASAAIGANAQSKAAKAAGKTTPVDIEGLDAQARKFAERNIVDSQRLEQQYSPETYNLRQQATQNLIQDTRPDPYADQLRSSLYGDFNQGSRASDLTQAAYDQALADIQMGGALPLDVRNQIARAAASSIGSTGNLGLGRDVAARDLGLSSLGLRNQRIATGAQLGGQMDQFNLANQQARQSLAASIGDLGQQQTSRRLALAQFGQSIAQPQSGLDPSSVVNLATGNQNVQQAANANAANLQGQFGNSLLTLGGQLGGVALGNYYNQANKPTSLTYGTSLPAASSYNFNSTIPASTFSLGY